MLVYYGVYVNLLTLNLNLLVAIQLFTSMCRYFCPFTLFFGLTVSKKRYWGSLIFSAAIQDILLKFLLANGSYHELIKNFFSFFHHYLGQQNVKHCLYNLRLQVLTMHFNTMQLFMGKTYIKLLLLMSHKIFKNFIQHQTK